MTTDEPVTTGGKQVAAADALVADDTAPNSEGFPGRARLGGAKLEDGRLVLQGTTAEHAAVDAAFGSASPDFQGYAIAQLLGVLPGKQKSDDYLFLVNSALAMLSAIGPRDELEAMLAVQMVAAHHAAMEMTGSAIRTDRVDFKQTYGGLATKFQRTFIAQLEALGRHRRGGKQIVEHVHVNAGGQAVIAGTVNTGGRG